MSAQPTPQTTARFVAYYRVSTDSQGESGLGLEAQRAAVAKFIGTASLLTEFQEIESGKRHTNRPMLAAAIEYCRKTRATLIIATLDRLARNVHFISGLMESGVPFLAADAPNDGAFILHMRAAFAEEEARKISHRTRAALHQVKQELSAQGHRTSKAGRVFTRLGNPRWEEGSLARARAARNPVPMAQEVIAMMTERRAQGMTYRKIAADLNAMGIKAMRGGIWHDTTVQRAIANIQ